MAPFTTQVNTHNAKGGDNMAVKLAWHGNEFDLNEALETIRDWARAEGESYNEYLDNMVQEQDRDQKVHYLVLTERAAAREEAFNLVLDLLTGRLAKLAEEFAEDEEAV